MDSWSKENDGSGPQSASRPSTQHSVKKLITSDMVLTHYDPGRPLRLASDVSPIGIGAVLSHIMEDGSERPIAFTSRTLTKAERNYSHIDKKKP